MHENREAPGFDYLFFMCEFIECMCTGSALFDS